MDIFWMRFTVLKFKRGKNKGAAFRPFFVLLNGINGVFNGGRYNLMFKIYIFASEKLCKQNEHYKNLV